MREEFKEEQVDLSDGEMMDSQFLTSKASMNEASDLGIKQRNSFDEPRHPTAEDMEADKYQHVTEISTYQEDEIIDSNSQPMRVANTSAPSRMLEEYKSNHETDEVLDEAQINEGIEYTHGGKGIRSRCVDEILKSTELKLMQKGKNTSRQPNMLLQARKYYNTQGSNMPTLGTEEALEIQNSHKPNQKVLNKYKDYKNQNMIGGNNFTLGLNEKLPSNLSSNRNNLRSLPDQESYNVSHKKLEIKNDPKPGSKGRKSSSASEVLSSRRDMKNDQQVLSVIKVQKIPTNAKNKKVTNRMVLYLVDKDNKDSGSRDLTQTVTNDTTARKSGGPSWKFDNRKLKLSSSGNILNEKEKKIHKRIDLRTANMKLKQSAVSRNKNSCKETSSKVSTRNSNKTNYKVVSKSRNNYEVNSVSSNIIKKPKAKLAREFRSQTRQDAPRLKKSTPTHAQIELFKGDEHIDYDKQASLDKHNKNCVIF